MTIVQILSSIKVDVSFLLQNLSFLQLLKSQNFAEIIVKIHLKQWDPNYYRIFLLHFVEFQCSLQKVMVVIQITTLLRVVVLVLTNFIQFRILLQSLTELEVDRKCYYLNQRILQMMAIDEADQKGLADFEVKLNLQHSTRILLRKIIVDAKKAAVQISYRLLLLQTLSLQVVNFQKDRHLLKAIIELLHQIDFRLQMAVQVDRNQMQVMMLRTPHQGFQSFLRGFLPRNY